MKQLIILTFLIAVTSLSARSMTKDNLNNSGTNFTAAGGDTNVTDNNKLKQGFWMERNGTYAWEGNYVSDKREGTWVAYIFGSPMVTFIENYRDGKKNGVSLAVDRAGYIFKQENYKGDSLDGVYKTFYTGGRLKSEDVYKNGKLNGLRKYYTNNNKIQEEGYFKDGVREGLAKWYFTDGKLNTESIYKNGNLEGKMTTYYSNGKKSSEVFLKKMRWRKLH